MIGLAKPARLALFVCSILLGSLVAPQAWAQDRVWIQIEAQPSLVEAQERARDYARLLPNVNGFSLGNGWYGIALGPYDATTARATLRTLRQDGQIPRDSYVAQTSSYQQQFWPIGANALAQIEPRPAPILDTESAEEDTTGQSALREVQPKPDETPRQARASETQLTRLQRERLQTALAWAGHYTAAIDGSFGRGTRAAMSAWQVANGVPPTGVLTTRQRATLLAQYDAVLEGVDLERVADPRLGIEMLVPKGLVVFDGYESPFARYGSSGNSGVQLIKISRPGDQRTLFGLYEILQTLEVVPPNGPRDRRRNGFFITGENARIISETRAVLQDGTIKGYILVWPVGDEERRSRVLSEIEASFRPIEGVLPLDAGLPETQSIDLLAGLDIRKPLRGRSGVYVNARGSVLTAAEAVNGCGSITINDIHTASVTAKDTQLGVALITPEEDLAPPAIATFRSQSVRLQSEIAVAGYSFEGVLGAPTLTFGRVADIKGLDGAEYLDRLSLDALPGDVGGPIFDMSGAVAGILLPNDTTARTLPPNVAFAADAVAVLAWAQAAGLTLRDARVGEDIAPETLSNQARPMTALVSCWE